MIVLGFLGLGAIAGSLYLVNSGPLHPQAKKARTALAEQLNVSESDIKIVSTEETTWGSTALGTSNGGLQVITPGYRIEMRYKGTTYFANTGESSGMYLLDEDNNVLDK